MFDGKKPGMTRSTMIDLLTGRDPQASEASPKTQQPLRDVLTRQARPITPALTVGTRVVLPLEWRKLLMVLDEVTMEFELKRSFGMVVNANFLTDARLLFRAVNVRDEGTLAREAIIQVNQDLTKLFVTFAHETGFDNDDQDMLKVSLSGAWKVIEQMEEIKGPHCVEFDTANAGYVDFLYTWLTGGK